MKDTTKPTNKIGGPSGDHGSSATTKVAVEKDAKAKADNGHKRSTSKAKQSRDKSSTAKKLTPADEKKERERRERERRDRERYERDVIESERRQKELEFERWEREQDRERERARRGKGTAAGSGPSRYKPRKPPAGYKDPHEACKPVLSSKVKEERRQEIKALMNCIAFDEESATTPAADGDKVAAKAKSAIEEMDNSLSSDTTSDMTDVTPRSSSSGCSSMSKQSVNYNDKVAAEVAASNNKKQDGSGKAPPDETKTKRASSKKTTEGEISVTKSSKGKGGSNARSKGKGDNQETETEMNEAEMEEMKYLEDAFEDLDIDDQATDFASSIITGLSEERRAKCGRKNMTFTNEQLREIERVNLILLKKIMGQRKPRMKSQSQPPVNRRTSAAINRSRMEERIERENKILLKKLQSAKGTTGTLSRKNSQTQAYY